MKPDVPTIILAEAPRPVGLGVRFAHLDGIRALAAVYVILDHHVDLTYGEPGPGYLHFGWWFDFGHYAVDVFIVLSGYCLMLPVARAGVGRLGTGMMEYIRRRGLRILPPYFAALLLSVGVWAALGRMNQVSRGDLIAHLLLVHNFSPTWVMGINSALWTVAVEWQIYFAFPFILLPIYRRWGNVAVVLLALAIGMIPHLLPRVDQMVAGHITYFQSHPNYVLQDSGNLDWSCPWFVGLFAMGMVAAEITFRPIDADESRRRLGYAGACVGMLVVILWTTLKVGFIYSHPYLIDSLVGGCTAVGLAWAGRHCMNAGERRPVVIRLLSVGPLVWVGTFSYSLYLIHLPVWHAVEPLLIREPLRPPVELAIRFLVGVPIVVLCSYLFFLLIEKPAMGLRALRISKAVSYTSTIKLIPEYQSGV